MTSGVKSELWDCYTNVMRRAKFVDLTHTFMPGQPRFPTFPDEQRAVILDYGSDGARVHHYSLVGQWGTHVDPPSHFHKGARSVDQIPVAEMLLPLVVIDISARVKEDPDAVATLADIAAWEERNGPVPERSFVALRTDWYLRWPDPVMFRNADAAGVSHTPGWTLSVLNLLFEERSITAIGHEQIDTDPGISTSQGTFELESYVLGLDRWQIELLCNLDKVPEAGALILASWPKPLGGSGFPARAVAILGEAGE